jgi:hypothetical protein
MQLTPFAEHLHWIKGPGAAPFSGLRSPARHPVAAHLSTREVSPMPPKKAPSESKTGLVVTLVFFILATLGLGVATYYGFAEQEQLGKAKKDAEKNEKLFKDERDYYKAQANLFRHTMGHPIQPDYTPDEVAQNREHLAAGTGPAKGQKSQEDVKKLVGDLEKRTGWDAAGKKAKNTYEALLAKAQADYENAMKDKAGLEGRTLQAEKKQKEAEDQLADARKTFDAELVKITQKSKDDQANDRKSIEELRNELAKLSTAKEEITKKGADDLVLAKKEIDARNKQIKKLHELVAQRNEELAQYKLRNETPVAMRTDWKITYMDRRGTMPYINIGSADKARPQLTFSIHGPGLDGRPSPTPKGTLEVINVLEPHLSQTRITSVKDPNRDPIVVGDMLYNPLWNPNLKKHVAIAGVVDLSGGSRDPASGMDDFLRSLERQNIIVDAYMDPKENYKIKGPGINVSTDYLILAESLEFTDGRERANPELTKKVDDAVKEMKRQASENGVGVLGLRKYLEMIGYRLPPQLAEPTGVSPLYKPRPDQLPPPPPVLPPREKPEAGPNK